MEAALQVLVVSLDNEANPGLLSGGEGINQNAIDQASDVSGGAGACQLVVSHAALTYRGHDKLADILQKVFSNTFSSVKIFFY